MVDLVNLLTNAGAGGITTEVQSPGKLKDSFITTTKTLKDLLKGGKRGGERERERERGRERERERERLRLINQYSTAVATVMVTNYRN